LNPSGAAGNKETADHCPRYDLSREILDFTMSWYLLTRRDIAAILLLFGIVGALFFVYVAVPNVGWSNSNRGFGPNWECTNPGYGQSVCIKKLPANEAPVDRGVGDKRQ
jgi:hypothetical protein